MQSDIENSVAQNQTLELLGLLPSMECISPQKAKEKTEATEGRMNTIMFLTEEKIKFPPRGMKFGLFYIVY